MRSGADPCLRLVLAHLEHAAGSLCLRHNAPPGYEGAREGGIGRSFSTPRLPDGVGLAIGAATPTRPNKDAPLRCVGQWADRGEPVLRLLALQQA
jgi:hypothetical protein